MHDQWRLVHDPATALVLVRESRKGTVAGARPRPFGRTLDLCLQPGDAELEAAAEAEQAAYDASVDAADEALFASARHRGKQKNLSFFAFTATPKPKTLDTFGQVGADGHKRPFHTYSMRQAIAEGFILDVLANYTTYGVYYNSPTRTRATTRRWSRARGGRLLPGSRRCIRTRWMRRRR
ncbi:hypothetical protein [Propioniciclava sinopodophylli]|uniref:hypothetical protein n=1 Tax=Propioniciclava sinopodophylli TaxID=1837344 RepID=UPI002490270D|nr:hypothetical protein [Propioniciclava sinopodophylli]